MSEPTYWETIKVEGGQILDKVKQIVREGNVRRIVIKQGDRTIAEFPLTVGVVGAVFAAPLAAVGAIAALVTDCAIYVEREAPAAAPEVTIVTPDTPPPAAAAPPAGDVHTPEPPPAV